MSESFIQNWGIAILLLPLAGAAIIAALGRPVLRGASHWPAILGVGGAAIGAFAVLSHVMSAGQETGGVTVVVYQWIAAGTDSWFNVEFWVDPLTAVMLVTVTFVSLLVVIYSRDYMRHHDEPERGYERFFAFLALFVFSMCALVLAGNFLLLYLGWELVGLCSYLLIGFYYQKPAAAAAAKKAFLVNRIGDFGFGLGILLIYLTIGRLDYESVFAAFSARNDPTQLSAILNIDLAAATEMAGHIQDRVAAIALLLLCGAVGKSAQLPLHVWLPDAMEGPSPVSALIHAATMVTAGVYMIARCGAIFAATPAVMMLVAVVGGVTALFAATIAITQHDMKRILAYSTISQLGYMFMGVGVYAASSAVFHLFTHAFFKALLFLSAGSVMHAMGGVIDLRQFGGLRRLLPWTFRACLVGSLALAGVPLLAGFWSKDEIIHHAFGVHPWLGWLGLATALMTAFYTGRMLFRAFYGPERVPEGVHAHESGKWMLAPLGVLAIGAVFAGYAGVSMERGGFLGVFGVEGGLHSFLEPVFASTFAAAHHSAEMHGHWQMYGLMYISSAIAVVGLWFAWQWYVKRPWLAPLTRSAAGGVYDVLSHKYYVDELYDVAIVRPLRRLGGFCFAVDSYLIDTLVWMVTAIPRGLGFILRGMHGGSLQGYGVSMGAGLAIIVIWMLLT